MTGERLNKSSGVISTNDINYVVLDMEFVAGLFKGELKYKNKPAINVATLSMDESRRLFHELEENAYEIKDLMRNSYDYDMYDSKIHLDVIKQALRVNYTGLWETSPKEIVERSKAYKIAKTNYMQQKAMSSLSKTDTSKNNIPKNDTGKDNKDVVVNKENEDIKNMQISKNKNNANDMDKASKLTKLLKLIKLK